MRTRLALAIAFIGAVLLFALPALAAPMAQNGLPDFTLNAQTVISVTVAISDGHVIVVPVELTFITHNEDGETDVTLITDVEQQAGIFIGVAPASGINATLQLPASATATAAAATAAANEGADADTNSENVTGTHVTNRNSNRRAGPGTNFQVVGSVPAGGAVTVVGQNQDGTWLELDDGSWMAEFLLDPVPNSDNNAENSGEEEEDGEGDEESDEEEAEAESTPDPATAAGNPAQLTAYLAEVASIGADAAEAVAFLTGLVNDPQPLSSEWRDEVGVELAVLSNVLDQFLDLTPVPGYEDVHEQVTDVALSCEEAVDYLVSGLSDPASINTALAIQSVQACSAQATILTAEIQSLQ